MIDLAVVKVKAGDGGDGKVSFRREKFIPYGGPDGGDGGKGGNVILVADNNMATLIDFHTKPIFKATPGGAGGKKKMFGLDGQDLYIKVPVGTLIYEIKKPWSEDPNNKSTVTEEKLVCDMHEPGQEFLIAKAGRGGKGNDHFKSSTNQTPVQYTPGQRGEEKTIKLEVKLMADVGFVGLPNVGKSTLINKLTNTHAKVANYPFTTLTPNLGVYTLRNGTDIVIADIPGLIEGASEGKGLGDDFLRHVQRTRVIVHLVDPFGNFEAMSEPNYVFDPGIVLSNYLTIREELKKYGKGLDQKPEIIFLNKIDITEVRDSLDVVKKMFKKKGLVIDGISAATGEGIDVLTERLEKLLADNPKIVVFEPSTPIKMYNINNLPNKNMVFNSQSVMEVDKPKAKLK